MSELERVITDTIHHVGHSTDPELHRSQEHIDSVVRPHVERIYQLLHSEESMLLLAIATLKQENEMAALSLEMLVAEIRHGGVEHCLQVCAGKKAPTSI